jgi:hypothetical protein
LRAKTMKKKRSYSISSMSEEEKGKIMENENNEETKVDFKVYKDYLRYYGGYKMLLFS